MWLMMVGDTPAEGGDHQRLSLAEDARIVLNPRTQGGSHCLRSNQDSGHPVFPDGHKWEDLPGHNLGVWTIQLIEPMF